MSILLLLFLLILSTINNVESVLNIGQLKFCYIDNIFDESCIVLLISKDYFIVRKACFYEILKKEQSMYIYFNNKYLLIRSIIETYKYIYIKTDYNVTNELNNISFNNDTNQLIGKKDLFLLTYNFNSLLNVSMQYIDTNYLTYKNSYFIYSINKTNSHLNYYDIQIKPSNNKTYIPQYKIPYSCNNWNFRLMSLNFYNDQCEVLNF